MLFFKIEKDLWSYVKTFVVFLNRLPEYPRTYIHEIECDQEIQRQLERMTNGEIKN